MNAGLHRFAIALATLQLIAIVSGAFITSNRIALGLTHWSWDWSAHVAVGVASLLFALGVCIRAQRVPAMWLVFASLALTSLTGWPSLRIVWHAIFAHLSFGFATAAAVLSSRGWSKPAEQVDLGPWSALRPAAIATPPAVLVQITLGALYRHQIIGVMPHMLGAMVVALLTLLVSVVLLQHFAACRPLKSAATVLISMVLTQVCLGIGVFIMLLLDAANTNVFAWTATGHVCVGALALAASVVTAMQVVRLCGDDTRAGHNMRSIDPST